MISIEARNVQQAIPKALQALRDVGEPRTTRNGDAIVVRGVFATEYHRPCERVLFYDKRDANPFFHLYEGLWMIAGRNDVAGPARILKSFAQFSDNGETFHGAYGYRWRKHFKTDLRITSSGGRDIEGITGKSLDQVDTIIRLLGDNPDDRRCVLQMWDSTIDLGQKGKDFPCNLTATFHRAADGSLDLTVYNRSNDMVWGAYGANAVHFSMLQEYMARRIGCEVGIYTQVSSNMHAYTATLPKLSYLTGLGPMETAALDPYFHQAVIPIAMPSEGLDETITRLLTLTDSDDLWTIEPTADWETMVWATLRAHEMYRNGDKAPEAAEDAAHFLQQFRDTIPTWDFIQAAWEWMRRRGASAASR